MKEIKYKSSYRSYSLRFKFKLRYDKGGIKRYAFQSSSRLSSRYCFIGICNSFQQRVKYFKFNI